MGRIETLKKGSRAYLRDGGDEAESDGTFLVTLDGRWDPRSREPKLNLCPSKWWIAPDLLSGKEGKIKNTLLPLPNDFPRYLTL